jgi:hypothetical protein
MTNKDKWIKRIIYATLIGFGIWLLFVLMKEHYENLHYREQANRIAVVMLENRDFIETCLRKRGESWEEQYNALDDLDVILNGMYADYGYWEGVHSGDWKSDFNSWQRCQYRPNHKFHTDF